VRDYDKEPIVVKDYGALFAGIFLAIIIIAIAIYAIGHNPKDEFKEFLPTVQFIAIMYCILCAPYVLILKAPKRFKKKPSLFEFSDNKIYHCRMLHEKNDKIIYEVTAPIKYIKQISFCIVTETHERHGRKHYLSSWGLFRKSSIAIPLTKLFCFTNYFCTYILLALPFKIYKLKKDGESLSLLNKNIVIEFTNRNYFLVNIYSQKEFDELMIYFKSKNIPIKDKTVFMHHWQILNPIFFDKDERWCDEYEEKEVEKVGIIKKITKLFETKK
jgi:hypothetical protein